MLRWIRETCLNSSLTRARIRAPFDGEIITHETGFFWHHCQCEDQDWHCEGQDSRRGGPRAPFKTIIGKTSCSRPVGSVSNQFPTRGTPFEQSPPRITSHHLARQIFASHDKCPPRTGSFHLAQQVSASHEKFPRRGVGHDMRRDPETRTSSQRCVENRFPAPCKHTSWWRRE
jgi:hypothetical protein